MKILLLCNKSPFPAREGGPIAMNMILEGLIRAGHTVKVLAINSNKYKVDIDSIPSEYRKKTGIELVDVDLSIKPLGAFLNLFSSRSYHVERFISGDMEQALIRILQSEKFDVVQFEMLFMSPYLDVVRKYSAAKIVLRTHNIEHLIWKRIADTTKNPLKRIYLRHLVRTLKNYECSVVRNFDGIAAITEKDATFFRSLAGMEKDHPPVISIPFGIDPECFPETKEEPEFPSLFSIGAMDWIPNLEGICWFLEKVWPELHSRFPLLRYTLAGRHMPQWLKEKGYPGVEVAGEVDDALAFMRTKAILVVPLFSGSGIRIKIIEGMAAGKTIVSTAIGAEGIRCSHGKDIFIADDTEAFIRSISACVEDKKLCESVGRNARKLILEEYNRDSIISKLLGFYQKIGR
ncbi:MAG: glycosyltransferase [Bacteroidetes bacterium]|nr:glycosyltransferase [Bacteroidota bacterium]